MPEGFTDEIVLNQALMYAVDISAYDLVVNLISIGAHIDCEHHIGCLSGKTPLEVAALRGDKKMVELLLDHGASIDRFNDDGEDIFTVIKKRNYDKFDVESMNSLIKSYSCNKFNTCDIGLSNDPELDTKEDLIDAILLDRNEIYWDIINNASCDFNREYKGYLILNCAIHVLNEKLIKALVKHGADPNLKDNDGKNAFDILKHVRTTDEIKNRVSNILLSNREN